MLLSIVVGHSHTHAVGKNTAFVDCPEKKKEKKGKKETGSTFMSFLFVQFTPPFGHPSRLHFFHPGYEQERRDRDKRGDDNTMKGIFFLTFDQPLFLRHASEKGVKVSEALVIGIDKVDAGLV